jgi:hypothetical protein
MFWLKNLTVAPKTWSLTSNHISPILGIVLDFSNGLCCLSNWSIRPPWNIKEPRVSWIEEDPVLAISGHHYPHCSSYRVSQQCNTNCNVSRFRVPWIKTHNLDSGKTNNMQHQGSRRWVISKLMLIKLCNYDSTTHIHQWYQQDSVFPHHSNLLPVQNWTYSDTKKEHWLYTCNITHLWLAIVYNNTISY